MVSFVPPGDVYRDEEGKVWRHKDTQEVIWITARMEYRRLTDMETTHIRNCLAKLLLEPGFRPAYVVPLTDELKRRGNN